MARVKGAMHAKKKHNRVLKMAKGYRGARSKQYRIAKQSVMRALTTAYRGRREKETVQTALDRQNQCGMQDERYLIFTVHARPQDGRGGDQQKDAG